MDMTLLARTGAGCILTRFGRGTPRRGHISEQEMFARQSGVTQREPGIGRDGTREGFGAAGRC